MASSPDFLNVDLDIESAAPLHSLEKELGKRVSVMFSGRMNGRHCLFIELAGCCKALDGTIQGLCELIEGLSPYGKRLWNAARRKEFDIGFEVRLSSHRANRFSIPPSTLQRVTRLGASVAVTMYREDRAEPCASTGRRGSASVSNGRSLPRRR
jgi:hypothetical protein